MIGGQRGDLMMKAIVYARVSTDAQERDGTSLDTQERACLEFAAERGWTVTRRIRDAASGASLERDGMQELRQALRRGDGDVVIAYAVDRLSRSQNHIGVLFDEFEQTGARLELVTERFEDTAVGRFILAARAFIAEVEREKITERTMRGKAERARSGRLPQATGKGCYGYRYDPESGRRELVEQQAGVVRRMFQAFDLGDSLIGIVNTLNEEGIPTFTGKRWATPTIFHILRNETYTGRTYYRRTQVVKVPDPRSGRSRRRVVPRDVDEWIEVPDATPRIVDDALFDRVQARLDDPERRRRATKKYSYGLSGHVRCRECGSAMVGQTQQRRYRYYRCRRAFSGPRVDRCPTRYVRADRLERAVLNAVAERLSSPDVVLREIGRSATRDETPDLGATRRLAVLVGQRERLLRLYQLGEIDDAYLERELSTIKAQQAAAERRLAASERTVVDLPSADELAETCAAIERWLAGAHDDDMVLLADALQLDVQATPEAASVLGTLPLSVPPCSDTHVRSMVTGLI